jgi:hypothetical protein
MQTNRRVISLRLSERFENHFFKAGSRYNLCLLVSFNTLKRDIGHGSDLYFWYTIVSGIIFLRAKVNILMNRMLL